MRRFSALLLSVLLVGAGCGGSEPTPPEPQIVGVDVTPPNSELTFLGAVLQLVGRVFRDDGSTVTGAALTWNSANPSVATVTANGLVTALGPGSTEITATFQNFTGTMTMVVSTPDCSDTVNLQPGAYQVFGLGCAIVLPAGSAGDRYRVAVVNQNLVENASLVTTVTVGAVGLTSANVTSANVTAAPTPPSSIARREPRLSQDAERTLRLAARTADMTRDRHHQLRQSERGLVESVGPGGVLPDLSGRRSLAQMAAARQVPARILLRANPGNSCSAEAPLKPALLIAENADMAVYQDSVMNADGTRQITAAQAQRILDYYSTHGKSIIDSYFHGVPDVDGNGKVILYSSFHDAIEEGSVAAYVWGGDLFDRVNTPCAASNEAEVMYFNGALIRALDTGFAQALETAVHEAKHISSFWQGISRSNIAGTTQFQPSWLEEGAAEIASNVSSRLAWQSVGGPAANVRVTGQMIEDLGFDENDAIRPEALGVFIRLVRAQDYLASQPNGMIVTPQGARPGHSVYGSGWTFLRWLGDAYGNAGSAPFADASFWTSQNDSLTAAGTAGIAAVTGKSFARILEEYAAGVMLHMTPSAPTRTAYDTYDFISSIEGFCFAADNPPCSGTAPGPAGTWPWPVTAGLDGVMSKPFATSNFTGPTGPTGLRIFEFESTGQASMQLQVQATQPTRVVVARVN